MKSSITTRSRPPRLLPPSSTSPLVIRTRKTSSPSSNATPRNERVWLPLAAGAKPLNKRRPLTCSATSCRCSCSPAPARCSVRRSYRLGVADDRGTGLVRCRRFPSAPGDHALDVQRQELVEASPRAVLRVQDAPDQGRHLGCALGQASCPRRRDRVREVAVVPARSEEHTSELQSRSDLVCR